MAVNNYGGNNNNYNYNRNYSSSSSSSGNNNYGNYNSSNHGYNNNHHQSYNNNKNNNYNNNKHQHTGREETAWDWFLRSERRKLPRTEPPKPTDPSSASWAFVHGTSRLAHVDAAWRSTLPSSSSSSFPSIPYSSNSNIPVLVIEGSIGKTWTLCTLAARFVVATRKGLFGPAIEKSHSKIDNKKIRINNDGNNNAEKATKNVHEIEIETEINDNKNIDNGINDNDDDDDHDDDPDDEPQVIILDSNHDVTTSKLANVVRSTLIRQTAHAGKNKKVKTITTKKSARKSGRDNDDKEQEDDDDDDDDDDNLEHDFVDCLSRIHIASVDDLSGWVPILEALRCKLQKKSNEDDSNYNYGDDDDYYDGDENGEEEDGGIEDVVGRKRKRSKQRRRRRQTTTLILWDGFLSEESNRSGDGSTRMEIIRQITRLLNECSIALVLTLEPGRTTMTTTTMTTTNAPVPSSSSSSSSSSSFWMNSKLPWETRTIRIEQRRQQQQQQQQRQQTISSGKDCYAIINGIQKIPLSLSLGGILS